MHYLEQTNDSIPSSYYIIVIYKIIKLKQEKKCSKLRSTWRKRRNNLCGACPT